MNATTYPGAHPHFATGSQRVVNTSRRTMLPAALLCGFFGCLGLHRFYVGKVGTGILQLLTAGGFGLWMLIDFLMIVTANFRDKEGDLLNRWTQDTF